MNWRKRQKLLEKEWNKPIRIYPFNRLIDSNLIFIKLKGIPFSFDKNGYDLFNEEFNQEGYDLDIETVEYSMGIKSSYLVRRNKSTGEVEYFHRWFMEEEIEDFCEDNNLGKEEVEVHHISRKSNENQKSNLRVMTKIDHRNYHKERRYLRLIIEKEEINFLKEETKILQEAQYQNY